MEALFGSILKKNNPSHMIGIDLGGTRIKGVVIDQNGQILHR